MPRLWTAEQIISQARNIARVPDTGVTGTTDADLLDYINKDLLSEFVSMVLSIREEHFTVTQNVPFVASTSTYRIPDRAIGQKLRHIVSKNAAGDFRRSLSHATRGEADQRWSATADNSHPTGYYLEGSHVVLLPPMSSSPDGSMDLVFFFRPGELVLSTATRVVSTVDASTKTVTFSSSVPSTWSTSNTFDVHSPKSGAEIKKWDAQATSVSGTSLVFSGAIDGSVSGEKAVAVGDYVCLEGEAAIPGLPLEMHPILSQACAVSLAEAKGDMEAVRLHAARKEQMLSRVLDMMELRVESKQPPIRGSRLVFSQGRWFGYY